VHYFIELALFAATDLHCQYTLRLAPAKRPRNQPATPSCILHKGRAGCGLFTIAFAKIPAVHSYGFFMLKTTNTAAESLETFSYRPQYHFSRASIHNLTPTYGCAEVVH
jgi:hypothetical protein